MLPDGSVWVFTRRRRSRISSSARVETLLPKKEVCMSATITPALTTAERAGWWTRAPAILIDARKQGWLDKIAGTSVVKA
jgi:hypothetical protein